MKRKTIQLLTLLWVLASCSETIDKLDDETVKGGQQQMMFSSELPATRAFITTDMLRQEGTILRLADIITQLNGERTPYFSSTNSSSGQRGSDLFRYTGGDWVRYRNTNDYGGHYFWTEHGTHKFFGWARGVKLNASDAGNTAAETMIQNYQLKVIDNPSQLDITDFSLTDDVTPQFDFIYTDVVMRDLDTPANSYPAVTDKYGVVPLTFHHLFSALAITIENQSAQNLVVTGLTMSGLKTKADATITFNDININNPTADNSGSKVAIPRPSGQIEEEQGGFIRSTIRGTVPPQVQSNGTMTYSKMDVFSKDANGTSKLMTGNDSEARLIWPQDVEKLTLTMTYKDSEADTQTKTKTVELDLTTGNAAQHLNAGEKYRINIIFKGDNVAMTGNLNVLPWDGVDNTLDIAIACNPSLALSYNDGNNDVPLTGEETGQQIHLKRVEFPNINGDKYIKLTFTPVSPQMGEWTCEIEDGNNNFTLDTSLANAAPNSDAVVTRHTGTIDGNEVTLYLRPAANVNRAETLECSLSFHVNSANVSAEATSQYNPENYLFVLPRNN